MTERDWLLKEKYHGEESPAFFEDLQKLEAGEPLAYLIGFTPFLDCHIDLSSRPLIPRPETEWWTELLIKKLLEDQKSSSFRVLDLFAGSGCIGVALLKHVPGLHVDFGELEKRHLETIATNIRANEIDESRTRIVETNIFSNLPGTYDLLLANPPYVDPARKTTLAKSLSYEPPEALFADEKGTSVIRTFLRDVPQHLKPNGVMYMEFDPGQEEVIKTVAEGVGLSVEFHSDQFGLPRLAVAQLRS